MENNIKEAKAEKILEELLELGYEAEISYERNELVVASPNHNLCYHIKRYGKEIQLTTTIQISKPINDNVVGTIENAIKQMDNQINYVE